MRIETDRANISLYLRVFEACLDVLGQPKNVCAGLVFCDSEEIRQVNRETRDVDHATDVLSFPTLALLPGESADPAAHPEDVDLTTGELFLGDVLICDAIAEAQAAEYGHSVEREKGYLFCHALLHLFGYDHMTDDDKRLMRAREEEIMACADLVREG